VPILDPVRIADFGRPSSLDDDLFIAAGPRPVFLAEVDLDLALAPLCDLGPPLAGASGGCWKVLAWWFIEGEVVILCEIKVPP